MEDHVLTVSSHDDGTRELCVSPSEHRGRGGHKRLVAGSMHPSVSQGSVMTAELCPAEQRGSARPPERTGFTDRFGPSLDGVSDSARPQLRLHCGPTAFSIHLDDLQSYRGLHEAGGEHPDCASSGSGDRPSG